ncbi:MAG: DEAD/DEAH box helicase [Sandaracinaceae bacterium]
MAHVEPSADGALLRATGLNDALVDAALDAGYRAPTPIQSLAIPHVLSGRDLIACARTGTGKTAAFAMPLLQRLSEASPRFPTLRALVLTPTRELAAQVSESITAYGRHLRIWHTVIFGGVNAKPQIAEVRRGIDILVATPGRLLDLMGQGVVHLEELEILVLDEADRMLDMGFLPDVRRILRHVPAKRQTLLFSATMPSEIRKLASSVLTDPVHVAADAVSSTAEKIEQRVLLVRQSEKRDRLVDLVRDPAVSSALVFSRTKHGANRLVRHLETAGVSAAAIHANKSQSARTRALQAFRDGDVTVLVATDIAARGIDIDGISHVINFEIPNVPETYVHRIGRTGRAGAGGVAVSLCDPAELPDMHRIERLVGARLLADDVRPAEAKDAPRSKSSRTWSARPRRRRSA